MRPLILRVLSSLPQAAAVYRAFLPRIRPHWPALAGSLALGGIMAVAEVLRPWPLQLVFDAVLAPSRHGRAPGGALGAGPLGRMLQPLVASADPGTIILAAAGTVLAVSVIGGIAEYAQTLLLSGVGQKLVAQLRRDLFRHMLRLPPSYHQSQRQGDLLMRLSGDIVMLRELLVGGMTDSVAALLVLAGTLTMMFWLDVRLTLLSLAIVPLVLGAGRLLGGRIRAAVHRTREKEGTVAANASEALGMIGVLQAFDATRLAAEPFERGNRSSLRSGLKASRLEAVLARSLDFLTAGGIAATLVLGSARVMEGGLTPGGLLVFLAYQRTLYRPVRRLARVASRAAKSAACGERVLEVLETAPAIADRPGATEAPGLAGRVTFEQVTVRYPRGDVALDDCSLDIPAGAIAVIRGESGAGKSTLLSLLPRLLDPTSGVVRLDGVDIREWTLESLRAQIAMVFQESVLMGLSVRENILLGRPGAGDEDLANAAEMAGVLRFTRELPRGLETIVGERGAQLSGGQRQRVALARAALRDARVLVLDEPFAHLDESSRDHVLAALRAVARGRTVLLVTHQDHPGLPADFEFELAGGRLVSAICRSSGDAPRRVVIGAGA